MNFSRKVFRMKPLSLQLSPSLAPMVSTLFIFPQLIFCFLGVYAFDRNDLCNFYFFEVCHYLLTHWRVDIYRFFLWQKEDIFYDYLKAIYVSWWDYFILDFQCQQVYFIYFWKIFFFLLNCPLTTLDEENLYSYSFHWVFWRLGLRISFYAFLWTLAPKFGRSRGLEWLFFHQKLCIIIYFACWEG